MDDDDFFRQNAFFPSDDEVVNAIPDRFHRVGVSAGTDAVVGLELVNQGTSHVVHFDVGFAFEVREEEVHLTVVGVGDDVELGLGVVLLEAIE